MRLVAAGPCPLKETVGAGPVPVALFLIVVLPLFVPQFAERPWVQESSPDYHGWWEHRGEQSISMFSLPAILLNQPHQV